MRVVATILLAVLLICPLRVCAETVAAKDPGAAGTAQKLDLNRASREDLIRVPGIGPRTAESILELRAKRGGFTRLEELLEVRGIKEKSLTALAAYLAVFPAPATTASPSPK